MGYKVQYTMRSDEGGVGKKYRISEWLNHVVLHTSHIRINVSFWDVTMYLVMHIPFGCPYKNM